MFRCSGFPCSGFFLDVPHAAENDVDGGEASIGNELKTFSVQILEEICREPMVDNTSLKHESHADEKNKTKQHNTKQKLPF